MKKPTKPISYLPAGNSSGLSFILPNKEEKYRALVENSIHAFFLTLPDGTILEINNAACKIFGYTAAELKKLKRWDFIDHNDPRLLNALDLREKNGFAMTEATGIKKNGERFPVEITSAFFIDTDGIKKTSTMVSDISERKLAEQEMRLSNERFDLVVKATNDLVWDWDLVSGEIYRSGSSLADVYGHCSNDTIKNIELWKEYLHPLDKERISRLIDYYINSSKETAFNFEYRFRKEDGSYAYINDKGYILRDIRGKVVRMIGAAEDITESKKTALAIQESEQRYKMFVQQSTEGIWRIELKEAIHISTPLEEMIGYCYHHAYVAECNDTFARMYGFEKADDIIGIPLNKIMPDNNPENMGYLLKFFSNGFKVENEISYETDKYGNRLFLLNNMVGIVEGEYIKRAWGTQRNITEQKKSEEALAESENRLRAIIQTDPECIKLLSREGIILEMNPAGLAMVEAEKPGQVIGKSAFKIILPEYHKDVEKLIQHVFEGRDEKLIFRIKGLKGRVLWLETHCVPFRNAAGEITTLLSVTRDITESKNAQAQLLASEEQYRYLFNNNPASIIIWDIDTLQVLEVNETAMELYGYSKEEFLDLSVLAIRIDDEKARLLELVEEAKKTALCKRTLRWKHLTKEGKTIIMKVSDHCIQYHGRNAVLSLGNNITEKVLLENSLNEERMIRNRQITEAVITGQEKERTQLGEELHDNINQILASTKLYLECSLRDAKPSAKLVTESKLLVEKAMTEIRKLSKSLLPPSLGEIGLMQALNELADNMKQVNELSISIHWKEVNEKELPNKLKLTIFRIMQEQLNNVIKHAEAKNVVISISKSNGTLRVTVKDDGIGFEPEQKRNGVGLRNISSRAEVNNGTVSINSKPGAGCELLVTFPLS